RAFAGDLRGSAGRPGGLRVTARPAPRLLVPWSAHPAEDGWAELAVLGWRVSFVVLNARNGPADDPAYLGAAQRLTTARLTLIGYVDTGYGRTPIRRVAADVRRWVLGYPVAG